MQAIAAPSLARHPSASGRAACSSSDCGSSSRVSMPRQRQQRQQRLVAAAAEPQVDAWGEPIEEGEVGILDEDYILEQGLPDGVEGKAGYTPYDLIDFTDIPLKHELVTKVDRPISEVYALWADRLNWPQWFSMIEEVGFKEGEDDLCALNMWYRWAMTPWLELYVALRRTHAEPNKFIVEEPEDGAPIVAAALFQEAEGGGTLVTLRVTYLLPRVLFEFAGQMAVYGDVDRKLGRCMERMRETIEGCDAAAVLAAGQTAMEEIRAGLPDNHRQQEQYYTQWEADKERWTAQQQQQQAADAAAAQSAATMQAAASAAEELSAAAAAARGAAAEAASVAAGPKAKRGRKSAGAGTVSSGKTRRGAKSKADTSSEQ